MPDTICRNCGIELIPEKCGDCKQSTNFFCPLCGYSSQQHIHINSMKQQEDEVAA